MPQAIPPRRLNSHYPLSTAKRNNFIRKKHRDWNFTKYSRQLKSFSENFCRVFSPFLIDIQPCYLQQGYPDALRWAGWQEFLLREGG
jgi:hypothetical protein